MVVAEVPSLWGALAWCFTRESLGEVLASDVANEHRGDRDTDLVVSQAIRQLDRRTYFHLPSLGTHVGGGISSLGHAPREASLAIDFDANYRQYVDHSAPRTATRDDTITVVIPNFNCGDYLPACIESLLRQTIDCEIVVVDDASTDQSLDVLRQYEAKIRVVRHDHNRGANPGD